MNILKDPELIRMVNATLKDFDDLMVKSKGSSPEYYFEWRLMEKMSLYSHPMREIAYVECRKYDQVRKLFPAIEKLFSLDFEDVYPKYIQEWVNELSELSLLIYTRRDRASARKFVRKFHQIELPKKVISYYKVCYEVFKSVADVFDSYPIKHPVLLRLANWVSSVKAVADMDSCNKLEKIRLEENPRLTERARLIFSLIDSSESEKLEFKSTFSYCMREERYDKKLKKECTKTICAFLNAGGGRLLVGVSDSGEILGLEKDLAHKGNSEDKFILDFRSSVSEAIGSGFYNEIEWHIEDLGLNNKVLIVEVKPGKAPCYHNGNEFFARIGPASEKITNKKGGFNNLDNYISSRFES